MALSFLTNIFTCAETKWISEEIENFFVRNNFIIANEVKQDALKIARDREKSQYSIRVSRLDPKEVALLIIGNIAYKKVASGQFHTYRGVLSMIGREYLRLFTAAINESIEQGYTDKKEGESDIADLQELIKQSG